MPTDLLLPAFILTLLANALLVAVAIRALRGGQADREPFEAPRSRPAPTQSGPERTTVPGEPEPKPASARKPPRTRFIPDVPAGSEPAWPRSNARTSRVKPRVDSDARGGGSPPDDFPTKPGRRRRSVGATPTDPPDTNPTDTNSTDTNPTPGGPNTTKGGATVPRPRRSATDRGGTSRSEADDPGPGGSRSGRRRFSLPPLDDDHERVNRSIETFLSGSDASDPSLTDASTVATTVAIVAIDRLEDDGSSDEDGTVAVAATVDRALRSAARVADRVTTTAPGRYRIVLPSTGELAARAYLRRVRATVEPSLEAVDPPLRLLIATATVLDDGPETAIAKAEARLDAAIASAASRTSDHAPRAAGN
jgi:hypothetical protein